jgi:hypothetical protein
MGRSIEVTGRLVMTAVAGVHLIAVAGLAVFFALPIGGTTNPPLAALLGIVAVAMAAAAWRRLHGDAGFAHFGSAADITYRPLDPGQAAKDRWRKAVRRLPGRDEERDEDRN